IYTYGSILWLLLLILVAINHFRAYPVKKSKVKDYELLHTESESRRKSPRSMSYRDSKSFESDREEWERRSKTGILKQQQVKEAQVSSPFIPSLHQSSTCE
ncbi:hypothetical protein OSTOST_20982, partial [Ostertagia ostertagi]